MIGVNRNYLQDRVARAILAEQKEAAARITELKEQRDDAIEQLKHWFELATKIEEDAVPVVLAGLSGYLRTARNGGMPRDAADAAKNVLEDYCRLYLGRDLVPVLRGIAIARAERAEAQCRVLEGAWTWLAGRMNLVLDCDWPDEEDNGVWQVHRVSGSVNDREWELVGSGATPLEAVEAARLSLSGGGGEKGSARADLSPASRSPDQHSDGEGA